MKDHGLEEFEYEREGVHIRLKRALARGAGEARASAEEIRSPKRSAPSQAEEQAPEAPPAAASAAAPAATDLHVIKSPIVGTFYAAPSAEADPFVTVGAKVEPGQALCIIEAMKLMNEIESDVAGEVVKIFVENGKPVEYGEALFGIRARGKK
jgi:acetyl-CoA carboxylase biotin carboxyl carrier protein